jgi:hypothetical protein
MCALDELTQHPKLDKARRRTGQSAGNDCQPFLNTCCVPGVCSFVATSPSTMGLCAVLAPRRHRRSQATLEDPTMDARRFDALARSLSDLRSRRGLARLLGGLTLAGPLAAYGLSEAGGKGKKRKKKHKKKCKPNQQKCGKTCIPATSCCTDAQCGVGGFCANETCTCFSGFRPCNGTCITEEQCCANSDCGEGAVCREGVCRCLSGFIPCEGLCIPASTCCTSADCGAGHICLVNRSCARACTGIPADCPGCFCSIANTEGQRVCVPSFADCAAQACESTSQCPHGQHCQHIDGCPTPRCVTLCPGD